MTTSGVSAYELNLNQIVTEAYSLAQILADGESLTAQQMVTGRAALNAMVKTWETDEPLWGLTEGVLSATPGQASFTMGPSGNFTTRPLKIYSIRYRQFSGVRAIDTPMMPLTHDQYFDLPQKQSTGIPTQWYYDPQLGTGVLYVWPTVAAGMSIELRFTYQRKLEDFLAAQNTPDFPQEWTETLIYNLAVRLGQRYGQGVEPDIMVMAEQLKRKLNGWDRQQSVYINPMGYGGVPW